MIELDNKTSEKAALLKNKLLEIMPSPMILETNLGGLTIARMEQPTSPHCTIYKPMVLLILQGEKHTVLGTEEMNIGPNRYLLNNLEIPSSCHITEASPEKPYLGLHVELNADIIADLLKTVKSVKYLENVHRAIASAYADTPLIDAFLRLVELIPQSEEQQKILAPMVIREIHYRLLTGSLGKYLMTINAVDSKDNQILKAVEWIKEHYNQKINIEELAATFGTTASTFYRNFMKVTSMSPIQYQKQMRLNEAKRLMLAKNFDVQKAAYTVGYESITQFSKEYKRMFGLPPFCDIKNMKSVKPD